MRYRGLQRGNWWSPAASHARDSRYSAASHVHYRGRPRSPVGSHECNKRELPWHPMWQLKWDLFISIVNVVDVEPQSANINGPIFPRVLSLEYPRELPRYFRAIPNVLVRVSQSGAVGNEQAVKVVQLTSVFYPLNDFLRVDQVFPCCANRVTRS